MSELRTCAEFCEYYKKNNKCCGCVRENNGGEDVTVQISQIQFEEYSRLKQENEELKALCDTYFTCYRAKHNDIEGNLFSYRKALEEIREMLRKTCSYLADYECHKKKCDECGQNSDRDTTHSIIDKINEVLGDYRKYENQ